jgi:hypothetical protein
MYLLVWTLGIATAFAVQDTDETSTGLAMLRRIPAIDADSYRCENMARVVNYLRGLGRARSIKLLREFLDSTQDEDANERTLVVCRLLFVNPKGWQAPRLGETLPKVEQKATREFPLFPIAVSNRVPFLLVRGYQLKGLPEHAVHCLNTCGGLQLVKEDYSVDVNEYKKAAEALISRSAFLLLFNEVDRDEMIAIIRGQTTRRTGDKGTQK